MDEPVVLPCGTEVSAKYKGAFCEAKIKKINRNVRCKITPIDTSFSQAMINETEIQSGLLKIGSTLTARLANGNVVEATLNKLIDQSQYTVVFDDGDVATLKRNSLCLKSGKHFAESDTLDQLPLTNPEHFGNPVSLGRRRTRKNIFSPGDTPQTKRSKIAASRREVGSDSPDSDSEKLSVKKLNKFQSWKSMKDPEWGKVVCLEYADKRGAKNKDSWFPALVTSDSASKSDLYTVKSFCDDRLYKVSAKDAKEFVKSDVKKFSTSSECSAELRVAIEKAIKYIDQNILPENWSLSPRKIKKPKTESIDSLDTNEDESNSSSLTTSSRRKLFKKFEEAQEEDDEDDFTDSNIEIEDDDDEEERKEKLKRQQQQQEERDVFVAQLFKFMDERGTPINNCPSVNGKELNLYRLHQLVTRLGGPNKVSNKNAWKKIFDKLGLSENIDSSSSIKLMSPSSKSDSEESDDSSESERAPKSPVSQLKRAYQKYVHPFHDLNRKLGSAISLDFSRKASRPSRGERKREEERTRANTSSSGKPPKKLPKIKAETGSETDKVSDVPKKTKDSEMSDSKKEVDNTDSQITGPSVQDIEFDDEINDNDKVGESTIRIGDGLKVKYGKGKQLKVYEAKVLKTEFDNAQSQFKYLVHYYGWSSRYDEWIYKSRIKDVLRDKSPRRRTGKVKNKGEPLVDADESEDENGGPPHARTHSKSESSSTPKPNKPPKNQASTSTHKERSNSLSKFKSSEESQKPPRRIRTSSCSEKSVQPSPKKLEKIREEEKSAKKPAKIETKSVQKEKPPKPIKVESDDDSSLKKKDRKRSREEEQRSERKKSDPEKHSKKEKLEKKRNSEDEKPKKGSGDEKKSKNGSTDIVDSKPKKEHSKKDKKSDEEKKPEEEPKSEKATVNTPPTETEPKLSKTEESKPRRKNSAEEVKPKQKPPKEVEQDQVQVQVAQVEPVESAPVKSEDEDEYQIIDETVSLEGEEEKVEEKPVSEAIEVSKDSETKVVSKSNEPESSPPCSLVIDEGEAIQEAEKQKQQQLQQQEQQQEQTAPVVIPDEKEKEPQETSTIEKIEVSAPVIEISTPTLTPTKCTEIKLEAINSPTPIEDDGSLVCDEIMPLSPAAEVEKPLSPIISPAPKEVDPLICNEKLFEVISDEEDFNFNQISSNTEATMKPSPAKGSKISVPSNIAANIMKITPTKAAAEDEEIKGSLADDEQMDDDDDEPTESKSKTVKMSKKRDSRSATKTSSGVNTSRGSMRSPDSSIDEDDNTADDEENDQFERKTFRNRKRDSITASTVDDKFKSPVQSPKKRRRGRTRSISGEPARDSLKNPIIEKASLKETQKPTRKTRKGATSPITSVLSDPNNSDDNIMNNFEGKTSNPKALIEFIGSLSPIRDQPYDYTPWEKFKCREKYYLLEPIDTTQSSGKIVEILTDRVNTSRKNHSELKTKLLDAERRKKKIEREEKERERKALKELAKIAAAGNDHSDSDSSSDNASTTKRAPSIRKSSSIDSANAIDI